MSYKYVSSADIATIEILATNRAKERAAKKTGLPYSFGKPIETFGFLEKEERHIHVDLSHADGWQKYAYHKLIKKYRTKEYEKFLHPNRTKYLISLGVIAGFSAAGLLITKCTQQKSEPRIPTNCLVVKKAKPTQATPPQQQNIKE